MDGFVYGEGLEPQFLTSTKKHTGATSTTEINMQPRIAITTQMEDFFRRRYKNRNGTKERSGQATHATQAHPIVSRSAFIISNITFLRHLQQHLLLQQGGVQGLRPIAMLLSMTTRQTMHSLRRRTRRTLPARRTLRLSAKVLARRMRAPNSCSSNAFQKSEPFSP